MSITEGLIKILKKGFRINFDDTNLFPYVFDEVFCFLSEPNERNAYQCYKKLLGFFNRYHFTEDSIDRFNKYEKSVGQMIPNFRVHFLHSLYVYSLGLCFYISSTEIRNSFKREGNFLYLWTLTSLLHDIGYPMEIACRNLLEIFDRSTLSEASVDNKLGLKLLPRFINSLAIYGPGKNFTAWNIIADDLRNRMSSSRIDSDFEIAMKNTFLNEMLSCNANHGTYSAIFLLKSLWPSYANKNDEGLIKFLRYAGSASSAIYFHTNWALVLNRPEKSFQLSLRRHPAAFLLYLCDELQEWGRFHPSDLNKQEIDSETTEDFNKYKLYRKGEIIYYKVPQRKLNSISNKLKILFRWRNYLTLLC